MKPGVLYCIIVKPVHDLNGNKMKAFNDIYTCIMLNLYPTKGGINPIGFTDCVRPKYWANVYFLDIVHIFIMKNNTCLSNTKEAKNSTELGEEISLRPPLCVVWMKRGVFTVEVCPIPSSTKISYYDSNSNKDHLRKIAELHCNHILKEVRKDNVSFDIIVRKERHNCDINDMSDENTFVESYVLPILSGRYHNFSPFIHFN